jgi:hypothetical protein
MKIKANFTKEMIEDIKGIKSMDVVAELESILVSELKSSIRKEKRRESIKKIINGK